MRIKTQFIVTLTIFGILLFSVASSVFITSRMVAQAREQENIAGSIAQGASELSYLANDYVIYGEFQQRERWQNRFTSFLVEVSTLNVYTPEQQNLVNNINENAHRLEKVFESVVSAVALSAGSTDPDMLQVSWSRLAIQSQALVTDASRLSRLMDAQVSRLQRLNVWVIITLIVVVVVYFLLNNFVTQRRAMKGLEKLRDGIAAIGGGNLDFRIEDTGNDEIGDIGHALNLMADDLRRITASKEELEQEIRERERAKTELQMVAEQKQMALDAARMGWWHFDPNSGIVMGDERFREIFEVTELESKVDEILKHLHPEDRGGVWSKVEAALDPVNPQVYSLDYRILTADGKTRWVEAHGAAAFEGDGKNRHAVSFVGTVIDITDRKQSEEELRHSNLEIEAANRELEAFSYSVSHDLRAPLRSMEGFSNALIEDYGDKLDDQAQKYLRFIQESSDLMGQLIEDLLKLSRVVRDEINFEQVNLSDIAFGIARDYAKQEPGRNVNIVIPNNIMAYGDRALLRLVLDNLIGNAWKFSARVNEPKIEMGVKEINGETAYLIRDNGVGFDMSYANKLFKPFQRLHKASEFPGTGIGLATVQRIIHRHGGKVWVESAPGKGTTIFFTLG